MYVYERAFTICIQFKQVLLKLDRDLQMKSVSTVNVSENMREAVEGINCKSVHLEILSLYYSLNPRLGAGERPWFIVPNNSLEKLYLSVMLYGHNKRGSWLSLLILL
jgi:hypothetical protein